MGERAFWERMARAFSLIPLAPGSKRPILNDWPCRGRAMASEVFAWLDAGYGIGLVLGRSSGNVIALDIDSEAGRRRLFELGGVPICPTIVSERGPKYLLRLPGGVSAKKLRLGDGLELLGDGCQVVLPVDNGAAPDERFWAISPDELGFEVPLAHGWLIERLRIARGGSKPAVGAAGVSVSGPFRYPQEIFGHSIWRLGLCRESSSTNSLVVTRAIVHRALGNAPVEAYKEILGWQAQFPGRYSAEELKRKVAYCYDRGYLCSPQTLQEITGLDATICAQFVKVLIDFSPWGYVQGSERERARLSSAEIDQRLFRATFPCFFPTKTTIARLAAYAGIAPSTLKMRIQRRQLPWLVGIVTVPGRGGHIWVLNLAFWLLNAIFNTFGEKVTSHLMCVRYMAYICPIYGVMVMAMGYGGVFGRHYDTRAGPYVGGLGGAAPDRAVGKGDECPM